MNVIFTSPPPSAVSATTAIGATPNSVSPVTFALLVQGNAAKGSISATGSSLGNAVVPNGVNTNAALGFALPDGLVTGATQGKVATPAAVSNSNASGQAALVSELSSPESQVLPAPVTPQANAAIKGIIPAVSSNLPLAQGPQEPHQTQATAQLSQPQTTVVPEPQLAASQSQLSVQQLQATAQQITSPTQPTPFVTSGETAATAINTPEQKGIALQTDGIQSQAILAKPEAPIPNNIVQAATGGVDTSVIEADPVQTVAKTAATDFETPGQKGIASQINGIHSQAIAKPEAFNPTAPIPTNIVQVVSGGVDTSVIEADPVQTIAKTAATDFDTPGQKGISSQINGIHSPTIAKPEAFNPTAPIPTNIVLVATGGVDRSATKTDSVQTIVLQDETAGDPTKATKPNVAIHTAAVTAEAAKVGVDRTGAQITTRPTPTQQGAATGAEIKTAEPKRSTGALPAQTDVPVGQRTQVAPSLTTTAGMVPTSDDPSQPMVPSTPPSISGLGKSAFVELSQSAQAVVGSKPLTEAALPPSRLSTIEPLAQVQQAVARAPQIATSNVTAQPVTAPFEMPVERTVAVGASAAATVGIDQKALAPAPSTEKAGRASKVGALVSPLVQTVAKPDPSFPAFVAPKAVVSEQTQQPQKAPLTEVFQQPTFLNGQDKLAKQAFNPAAMALESTDTTDVQQRSEIAPTVASDHTNAAGKTSLTPDVTPKAPAKPFAEALIAQVKSVEVGQGRTTVNLHPRGLGAIEVEVITEKDVASKVVVRVENPAVLQALRDDRHVLAHAIGVADSEILEFHQNDAGDQSGNQSDQNGHSDNLIGNGPATDTPTRHLDVVGDGHLDILT